MAMRKTMQFEQMEGKLLNAQIFLRYHFLTHIPTFSQLFGLNWQSRLREAFLSERGIGKERKLERDQEEGRLHSSYEYAAVHSRRVLMLIAYYSNGIILTLNYTKRTKPEFMIGQEVNRVKDNVLSSFSIVHYSLITVQEGQGWLNMAFISLKSYFNYPVKLWKFSKRTELIENHFLANILVTKWTKNLKPPPPDRPFYGIVHAY